MVDGDTAARLELVGLLRARGVRARGFATAGDFLHNTPDDAAACVLTEAILPDLGGAELIQRVIDRHDHAWPVIIVTGRATVGDAVALIKAGAVDVIERPFTPERILRAVADCLGSLAARDAGRNRRRMAEQRLAALTPRERQVFDGLIDGRSSKEIALRLDISPRTVEVFRARVMEKMQAPHLPSLVRTAVLLGLPGSDGDKDT
ncbi:LuxR C-terminal-related transcriptional regulator [Brevundimonas sp. PAMC22021]|nr:LuxR C-terminal-related transcriptional regulator [Brevundimonas sp. PAMC22021]